MLEFEKLIDLTITIIFQWHISAFSFLVLKCTSSATGETILMDFNLKRYLIILEAVFIVRICRFVIMGPSQSYPKKIHYFMTIFSVSGGLTYPFMNTIFQNEAIGLKCSLIWIIPFLFVVATWAFQRFGVGDRLVMAANWLKERIRNCF